MIGCGSCTGCRSEQVSLGRYRDVTLTVVPALGPVGLVPVTCFAATLTRTKLCEQPHRWSEMVIDLRFLPSARFSLAALQAR